MQLYISLSSVSIVCVLTLCVNWFLLNLSSKGGSSDVLYIVMLNMLLNTTMATKILEQKVSTLETDNTFYKQYIRLLQQKLDENVINGEYYGRVFVSKKIVDMGDRLYVRPLTFD